MPRLQVYLPDDLHAELKARNLPASELLQAAVRAEIRRLDLLAATDDYLGGLADSLARATPADRERAEVIVRRVSRARFGR
jgi:post-segregation antitoxin (ccd killing protein)